MVTHGLSTRTWKHSPAHGKTLSASIKYFKITVIQGHIMPNLSELPRTHSRNHRLLQLMENVLTAAAPHSFCGGGRWGRRDNPPSSPRYMMFVLSRSTGGPTRDYHQSTSWHNRPGSAAAHRSSAVSREHTTLPAAAFPVSG